MKLRNVTGHGNRVMETALNRQIAAINFDFGGVITTSPFAAIGMQAIMVTSAG